MKKLRGMAQGLRFTAMLKNDNRDASTEFTRVLAEDPPSNKTPSIAGNSEQSVSSIAAPVRHICTKCGTTVLFPPPMQRRTCSGCGILMVLSQDPSNPVIEDPDPSEYPSDPKMEEDGLVQKLKSWRRRSTNTGGPRPSSGGGGFAGVVSKVLSNQSAVSVRSSPSQKFGGRISVFSGRASVFSNATQASPVDNPVISALPEKPDFEDLLCVLLNLAAMVCSADLSDCNTVVQTFLWADAAALRTVTAKVTSGLETQQRQVRERRGRMSTLSESGGPQLGEIVRHFIEASGEHPDAASRRRTGSGTPPRCNTQGLGTPKQHSPSATPPDRTPASTKGSQEFAALYRSLSSGSRMTGVSRRPSGGPPSNGHQDQCIKEDKVLDTSAEHEVTRISTDRTHSREGSPTGQLQSLYQRMRSGSADTLGACEKSMGINPDGGIPLERRHSSITDISATSFSEFHQQKKTFSFASKSHLDQLANAKHAMKALLQRTKSFGLTWSPRSSNEMEENKSAEEEAEGIQPLQPPPPSTIAKLKKAASRGPGKATLARGVSTVSVQSSTSRVSEVVRGLLRRQASKNNCVAVGEIQWGMDGSARDEATERRVKQSQALARRYQRKEPQRAPFREEPPPLPSVPSAPSQPTPSAPSAPAPPPPAASSEDRGDANRGSLGSLNSKEEQQGKRFSDALRASLRKRSKGTLGSQTFGSEGEDDEGIVSKKSLFMFLVHELHLQRMPETEQPQRVLPEKQVSRLQSQISQLMLPRSMTGATDCTVPTAVLLDLALRDYGDDPGSPKKGSPTIEEMVSREMLSQVHSKAPPRLSGGFRKALSCEIGELTDIAETSTAVSGSGGGGEQEVVLSDQERYRRRKEQKKKNKQDPTKNTYGAILRNSYEQNIDGVTSETTTSASSNAAGQAARNQVEADRERLAAISGGGCRASASNAPPPADYNGDDESIIALGIAALPDAAARALNGIAGRAQFLGSSQAPAGEVRSGVTSDNNSLFSGEPGTCGEEDGEQVEDAAMSRWKARKAAKAHRRRCQTKMTYGAILKMEHEQEMEFEGATAPKPPLGQPAGPFGPPPPCGAPPPPLFGSAHDPSLLKATASSHSQSPTFGGRSEVDSDDEVNVEEADGADSISVLQYRHDVEDPEAPLRHMRMDDDDEEERRWDAIRRAQAAEEAMENDEPGSFIRDEVYVDADAEVAAIAAAMRGMTNGRHASHMHLEGSEPTSPQSFGHRNSSDEPVSPKGSVRSGSELRSGGEPISPKGSLRSGSDSRSQLLSEERSVHSRESNGAFPGILRKSTGSDEELVRKRDSCASQKTVDFDFNSNETFRLGDDRLEDEFSDSADA